MKFFKLLSMLSSSEIFNFNCNILHLDNFYQLLSLPYTIIGIQYYSQDFLMGLPEDFTALPGGSGGYGMTPG